MKHTVTSTSKHLILQEDHNRGWFTIQAPYANTANVLIGFQPDLSDDHAAAELAPGDSIQGTYKGKIYATAVSGTQYLRYEQGPVDELKRPTAI